MTTSTTQSNGSNTQRKTVNIGIDNAAVVTKGSQIIEHISMRKTIRLVDPKGRLLLGGKVSKLHRASPYRNMGAGQRW